MYKTFMAMVAALSDDRKFYPKNRKLTVCLPGLPLSIHPSVERSPEVKARKKSMRINRRASINRRGW